MFLDQCVLFCIIKNVQIIVLQSDTLFYTAVHYIAVHCVRLRHTALHCVRVSCVMCTSSAINFLEKGYVCVGSFRSMYYLFCRYTTLQCVTLRYNALHCVTMLMILLHKQYTTLSCCYFSFVDKRTNSLYSITEQIQNKQLHKKKISKTNNSKTNNFTKKKQQIMKIVSFLLSSHSSWIFNRNSL